MQWQQHEVKFTLPAHVSIPRDLIPGDTHLACDLVVSTCAVCINIPPVVVAPVAVIALGPFTHGGALERIMEIVLGTRRRARGRRACVRRRCATYARAWRYSRRVWLHSLRLGVGELARGKNDEIDPIENMIRECELEYKNKWECVLLGETTPEREYDSAFLEHVGSMSHMNKTGSTVRCRFRCLY